MFMHLVDRCKLYNCFCGILIFRPEQLLILAGEWDLKSETEMFDHQEREVILIFLHEIHIRRGYTQINDIALLILTKPFELSLNVATICLPPQNYNFDNKNCIVSGWEKTINRTDNPPAIMKKVELPTMFDYECEQKLKGTALKKHFRLAEGSICAGGEPNKNICKGNGGSSLVCPVDGTTDQYYQAGIVAWVSARF
jgi:plasma kallikrein